MTWHEEIAEQLGSNHSDTISVIRVGKNGAKRRTNRRNRHTAKSLTRKTESDADRILDLENSGITDYWME